MHHHFKVSIVAILLAIFLICAVFFSYRNAVSRPYKKSATDLWGRHYIQTIKVGLWDSQPTREALSWRYDWCLAGARASLSALGFQVVTVNEADLHKILGAIDMHDKNAEEDMPGLLVLSDARLMSASSVQVLNDYVRKGGHLLATYQTSFRDERNNGRSPRDYALGRLLGIYFKDWTQERTKTTNLLLGNPESMLFGLGERPLPAVPKNKKTSPASGKQMQAASPSPSASPVSAVEERQVVFDTWPQEYEPAAVIHGKCAYLGMNFFDPQNCANYRAIAWLNDYLAVFLGGRYKPVHVSRASVDSRFSKIREPELEVAPSLGGRQQIKVSLGETDSRLQVSALGGGYLLCRGHKAGSFLVEPSTDKAQPGYVILSEGGDVLARLNNQDGTGIDIVAAAKGQHTGLARWSKKDSQEITALGQGAFGLKLFTDDGSYRWCGYRGSLNVSLKNSHLFLRNSLALEDYLRGVVPGEVPATYAPEALKAMVCAARAYVLSHLGSHKDVGCDMCSSVHCQMYTGFTGEDPRIDAAVQQCAGQVLQYNGRIADTFYSACCGGSSDGDGDVWVKGQNTAYLKAVPDLMGPISSASDGELSDEYAFRDFIDNPPACACGRAGESFRWRRVIQWEEADQLFAKSLPVLCPASAGKVGMIMHLEVTRRTPGGRVAELRITTNGKEYSVCGDNVRWLTSGGKKAGAGALPSSLFYVDIGKVITFVGGGRGHGVGLCQEGIQGRAKAGQNYRQILEHYYPGAQLVQMNPQTGAGVKDKAPKKKV